MAPLTLYHLVPSRSCRVLWLIYELGLDVDIQKKDFLTDPSVLLTEDFKKINPHQKLPALVDNDTGAIVFESCAALLYLLEQYGDGRLAPPVNDAKARASFLQWIFNGETDLTINAADFFWNAEGIDSLPKDKKRPQVADRAKEFALKAFDILEKDLEGRQYLLGSDFTAADVAVGYACGFLKMLGLDDEKRYPNVRAYTERITSRPAAKKAFGGGE